jgi:hypothetical protein
VKLDFTDAVITGPTLYIQAEVRLAVAAAQARAVPRVSQGLMPRTSGA